MISVAIRLDMQFNDQVPVSLMLLSRILYLPENVPVKDQIKAALSSLPGLFPSTLHHLFSFIVLTRTPWLTVAYAQIDLVPSRTCICPVVCNCYPL